METWRREASFSYDSGPTRRGRREHWRLLDVNPAEVSLLRRLESEGLESTQVSVSPPPVIGTDAA